MTKKIKAIIIILAILIVAAFAVWIQTSSFTPKETKIIPEVDTIIPSAPVDSLVFKDSIPTVETV